MSTALQKHQAFSPRPDETGEWHPHKGSFSPLPPLAVQSREEGGAVFKKPILREELFCEQTQNPGPGYQLMCLVRQRGKPQGGFTPNTLFRYDSRYRDKGKSSPWPSPLSRKVWCLQTKGKHVQSGIRALMARTKLTQEKGWSQEGASGSVCLTFPLC